MGDCCVVDLSGVNTVLFDVGGTLLRPYPNVSVVIARVLGRHGIDVDPADIDRNMFAFGEHYARVYGNDESLWSEDDRQREMWMAGYGLLLERVGITENVEQLVTDIYYEFDRPECWRAFDGVEETFAWLKDNGFRVGLVSNWGVGLEELMDGIGLGQYVDTVVASAVVGSHKPKPSMFYMALERLGAVPEETVHVGDHMVADVQGAAAVGIIPIHVSHGANAPWDPTVGQAEQDTVSITAIPQVRELLESSRQ